MKFLSFFFIFLNMCSLSVYSIDKNQVSFNACTIIVKQDLSLPPSDNITYFNEIDKAITATEPGDVICLSAGVYPSFKIKNVSGKSDLPITIRPVKENTVAIEKTNSSSAGIFIDNSHHIEISGLSVTGGLYGVNIIGSSDITLSNNIIHSVGQEGIQIKSRLGNDTSNINVINNFIHDTGLRTPQYGEGIYIGNMEPNSGTVQNIYIHKNTFSNINNEAIDIKPNASPVHVIGNVFNNINLAFNGVITIATSKVKKKINGDYIIRGNKIRKYWNRSGYKANAIAVGNGNALIINNQIFNDIRSVGISVFDTFYDKDYKTVTLEKNTFSDKVLPIESSGKKNNNALLIQN